MTSENSALIADVGGTNARFALTASLENGQASSLEEIEVFKTSEYPGFVDALMRYIDGHLAGKPPKRACFAFACPVGGESINMTNNHWSFSKASVAQTTGIKEIFYVNDFEANALSFLSLEKEDLISIGETVGSRVEGDSHNYLFVGPGTGLGVCILCRRGQDYFTIPTEGGHTTYAPKDDLQIRIFEHLRERFSHISSERVLAGPGILNLYEALADIQGRPKAYSNVVDIAENARKNDDLAISTMRMFFNLLASASSNLAIGSGCTSGVYFTSDVMLKNLDLLDKEEFRLHFNNRGRFTDYMAKIPIYLVNRQYLGLLGASAMIHHRSKIH